MFYADVPEHHWLLIGSWATRTNDAYSDLDVVLCRREAQHPYFTDTLASFKKYAAAAGGVLDLFEDQPDRHRVQNVWIPELALDAGPEYYRQLIAGGIVMDTPHFMRVLATAVNRGRIFGVRPQHGDDIGQETLDT